MDGVNLSRILRRPTELPPDSPTSASSPTGSEKRGSDIETITASSTTGSSYTSCSRGSLPSRKKRTEPSEDGLRLDEQAFHDEDDEVAIGMLPTSSAAAPVGRGGDKTSPSNAKRAAPGMDNTTSSSSGGRDFAKKDAKGGKGASGGYLGNGSSSSGLPTLTKRASLKPHMELDDDTPSLREFWDALFYPEVYMKIFYALRITLLVALPLSILGRHPKTMPIFPTHVVIPLWGIVDCQYTVGEQIAQSIISVQCGIWTMIWGCANNAWGLLNHESAWWCACIFGSCVVSMFGSVRGKRLFALQSVMILLMENLPGGTELIFPVKVGRDMIMSTAFSLFQVFFPPRFISTECDALMAGGWKEIGRILRTAVTAVWTDDPIQSVIALGKLSTDPLQHVLVGAPPMLFFIMYEPWESTLRLELRKERLDIMKLCTPRIHSVTGTARRLVMQRVFNTYTDAKDKTEEAMRTGKATGGGETRGRHIHHHHHHHHHEKTEEEVGGRAGGRDDPHSPLSDGGHEPFRDPSGTVGGEKVANGKGKSSSASPSETDSTTPEYLTTVRRSVSKLFGINPPAKSTRQVTAGAGATAHKDIYVEPLNPHDDLSEDDEDSSSADGNAGACFAGVHRSKTARDPEMQKLKQSRLEMQCMVEQWLRAHGKQIIEKPLENFLGRLDDVLEGMGHRLNPKDTAEKVPFDALQDASAELETALNKIHFEILIKSDEAVDPLTYSSIIHFHLSMIALAERLVEYGLRMKNFDRTKYKSSWARVWEFFFYDWWKGFWLAVPKRLTLATPRDRRMLKDSTKMALAFGVSIVYAKYMDPDNVYYFSMAILLGVGWPTAGDTMVASVYRVTGVVCACSIAYVAVWHTHNLTQQLAVALIGVLIALLFRDVPPYSHTAQYCSMLICTALNTAESKMVLLARVVCNAFIVMTYYVICIFLFPTSVLKITQATEARAIIAITERFSALTDVMTAPLYPEDPDQAEAIDAALGVIVAHRARMWGLVTDFSEWLPKASAEPSTHGLPYPLAEQRSVHESLRRLAAVTDIVCAALRHLHRQGVVERDKYDVHAMLQAVVPVIMQIDRRGRTVMQDFLDAAARPYEWSPERATRHLSEFLFLSNDLHRAFYIAHRRNTRALRNHFREGVMNRTFAAAARANLLEPSVAAAAAVALGGHHMRRGTGHGGADGSLAYSPDSTNAHSTSPRTTTANTSGSQIPQNVSIHYAPGTGPSDGSKPLHTNNSSNNNNNQTDDAGSPVAASRNTSTATLAFHANMSDVEEDEAQYDELHPPPVTNKSVTASILNRLKQVEDASRPPSPRPTTSDSSQRASFDPSTFYLPQPLQPVSATVAPTGKPADNLGNDQDKKNRKSNPLKDGDESDAQAEDSGTPNSVPPNMSFSRVLRNNRSMTARDLEHALRPMEKQAEDEEYQAFIAKRRNPQCMLQSREFTLNHDLNSVISLLVAADTYYGEAEKLVKNMYHINSYAKSQRPLPGSSLWDVDPKGKKKAD